MSKNNRVLILLCLLIAGLIALAGAQFYQLGKSRNDEQFGNKVRAYLLENPTIIREMIQKLQLADAEAKQNRERQALDLHRKALENDGFSFVAGNPDGDVTIVEFFDYRCGYCKKSFPDLMQVVKADGNVRLVLKEFPILGDSSVFASRAAMASIAQGKYMEFHIALMESRGNLSGPKVLNIAEEVGLNVAQLEQDMKSEDISQKINQTYSLANALEISGTPAFVIGDRIAAGAIPPQQMMSLVQNARETKNNSTTN
ncbi:DsbA family protein [Sneathiella limimaris]|uniref:DsbA family protein n=1 Tax=Sneathiella limimaris TaxID=1964213 RepID=UPI00146F82B9|nr:DsbA family protein [Sneathiella limimaris]